MLNHVPISGAHISKNLVQFQSSITFTDVTEIFIFFNVWEEQGGIYSL